MTNEINTPAIDLYSCFGARGRAQVDIDETSFSKTAWYRVHLRVARRPISYRDFIGRPSYSMRNVQRAFATLIATALDSEGSRMRTRFFD